MSQTDSGRQKPGSVEKASLFSRSKPGTVRARYLTYLERDVRQRLAASIHAARFLDIGVNEKLNATVPWHYKALEGEQQFSNFDLAFKHFNGRVLLLGPPGSGKTTTLLNLALQLITEAQQNQAADIPLLFNLSKFGSVSPSRVTAQLRWVRQRKDSEENPSRVFEKWLVQMLVELPVEGLNRQVAQQWVDSGNIAPLLDGLDELNDTYLLKFAEILNQTYFREHPDQTVVVCSRLIDYQPVQQNKETRLRLDGAVILQPPTPEQIDEYLEAAQALALRDALRGDNALYEMAQTPLTLSMMTLAYGGEAPTDMPQELPFLERRRLFLDTYVERMVQRTARRAKGVPFDLNTDNDVAPQYPLKQTNHYLGWLAIKLSERSRTVFPLASFYDFLSTAYPPDDKRATVLKYGVAMVGIWVLAVLTNAGILLPEGWSRVWALLAIPLLAPGVVLLAAVKEETEYTELGDIFFEAGGSIVASAYIGACIVLVNQSVVSTLRYSISPAVTITTLGALGVLGFLLHEELDLSSKWEYIRRFVGATLLFLFLMTALGALTLWLRDLQSASYAIALYCAVVAVVFLRRSSEFEDARLLLFLALVAFGWIVLIGLGIGLGGFVDPHILLAMVLTVTVSLGLLALNDTWRGTSITIAAVAVVSNQLAGAAVAVLATSGVLLFHLIAGKDQLSRIFQWLILNPILKLTFALGGSIPVGFKSFLRYATNTMLLKDVGIEYEFVHRMLRDHFAVRELLPQLFRAEGEQRIKIIQRLSRQGDSSFDALASLMTNPDRRVRSAAIQGLGRIGIPKVFPIMQDRIENDPDENVRQAVVLGMRKVTDEEQDQILKVAINDVSPQVRRAVVMVAHDNDEVRSRGLQDESDMVFRQTLISIAYRTRVTLPGNLLSRNLLERLTKAILDADWRVARGGAVAVKGFYTESTLLERALKDPETIETAIPELSLEGVIAALLIRADKDTYGTRRAMILALSTIADQQMSMDQRKDIRMALLKALSDKDEDVREAAIPGLARLRSPETLRALRESLVKGKLEQNKMVLAELGIARDREAIPAIMKLFYNRQLRYDAAKAIGLIHDPSTVRQLRDLIADPNPIRQIPAIMALVVLRDRSAIPRLRELFKQTPKRMLRYPLLRGRKIDVRPYAAIALGRLFDVESLPELLKFSSSLPPELLVSQATAAKLLFGSRHEFERAVVKAIEELPAKEQQALHRKLVNTKRSLPRLIDSRPLATQIAVFLISGLFDEVWKNNPDSPFLNR